ncbi:MAG: ribosome maturation factor RimM [Bdellovibrionales bacterium]
MTNSQKICVGTITGPHGIKGEVILRSATDDPAAIFTYGTLTDKNGTKTFSLTLRGTNKGGFIIAIEGIATRNDAEALKNTALYINRSALPHLDEDEYYLTDLIGLSVHVANDSAFGNVINVHDYGGGIFLEISSKTNKSFMLPFKDEFVPVVDIKGGFIEAAIPEGWMKEEK